MNPISVMVVEDSPVAKELIVSTLNADPRLSVISAVDSAEKALRLIPRMTPNVICMDVRLPGMNGIEATRRIMREFPTPIVVVASDLRSETINNSMEAMRAGALSVVEKPTVESAEAYQAMARSLCNQFVNMSQVKVVRQRFNGVRRRGRASANVVASWSQAPCAIEAVGVVASTGGPAAVASLLQGLPPDFVTPILVVQHMGPEFLAGYSGWLGSLGSRKVSLAGNFERPLPGHVYVAPGHNHLTYAAGSMRLVPDLAAVGHVPSGDVLLNSLATSLGPRAVGVVLTGMGDDGARGLLAMRQAGAHTIVQDKATSAVYGMPGVSVALGAAEEELPIGAIAPQIVNFVANASEAKRAS